MKNSFLILLIYILCCCSDHSNKVYFEIDPQNRMIIIPISLNDSVNANVLFDTGAHNFLLGLDSSFLKETPAIELKTIPDTSIIGSAWSDSFIPNLIYSESKTIKIGKTDVVFNSVQVNDMRKLVNNSVDGLLNIPTTDTTHIWELNFENNYLEVHQSSNYSIPTDCFMFQFRKDIETCGFEVQFPIHLQFAGNDTIAINDYYLIDTGVARDIVIVHPTDEEKMFFGNRRDAIFTHHIDGEYVKRHTANATLFGEYDVDSLRVYFHSKTHRVQSKYILGLNFLKRFNLFFDMKNKSVGFQPIKNFERIVNPTHQRFHYHTTEMADGRHVVSTLADYDGNYYKNAGLKLDDEIVAFNGIEINDLTYNDRVEIFKGDTLTMTIIRDQMAIDLKIPFDKSEIQGD